MATIRPMTLTVVALAGVLIAGCTNDSRPKPIPVKGTVRYQKNEIPVGALVVFHPTDMARERQIGGKPFGKVGEDGAFTLTTYNDGDGAPEGEYGITVEWRPAGGESKFSLSSEGGRAMPNKLQPKYSDPAKPFQTVTVKAGGDNSFQFEVE